jgi:CheY-like chemotaxis protein
VIHQYRDRAAAYEQPHTPITSPATRGTRRAGSNLSDKRRVLYVNADSESRILVTRLSRRWHQVETVMADSAHAGVRSALAQRPDLIMLDVELSDMDGAALLIQLRALPITALTPIVALSADDTPEHRRALLEAGASACLARPVNIADVERYVGVLLGVGSLDAHRPIRASG